MAITPLALKNPQGFTVSRQRLSGYLAEEVVDLIRLEGLKNGDRLPSETQLVARLRSSRGVLREALVALEARGQLLTRPGVGRIVTAHSMAASPEETDGPFPGIMPRNIPEPASITQARTIIEPKVAFVVASRPPHAHMKRLEESVATMQACGADESRFLESDYLFHSTLSVCTENRPIVDMVESMWQLWRLVVWRHIQKCSDNHDQLKQQTITEHSAILAAVQRGHPISARKCMRQHIENEQLRFRIGTQET